MSLSLADGLENVGLSVAALVVCLLAVGFGVLIQNGMAEGLLRQRFDRAFDAIDIEWRAFSEAVRRGRAREALRRLRAAISGWFYWQNLTRLGRVGTAVVKLLALISVALLLINLVAMLLAHL